jgi:hypothetical protein
MLILSLLSPGEKPIFSLALPATLLDKFLGPRSTSVVL